VRALIGVAGAAMAASSLLVGWLVRSG
jgi:hypothetical protein